jgi:hypothetical protein
MTSQKQSEKRRSVAIPEAIRSTDGVVHVPPGLPHAVDRLLDLLVDRFVIEMSATSAEAQEIPCND